MSEKMRYCSVCHRSEEKAGRLIDMPGTGPICNDCMQKMISSVSAIDFQDILRMLQTFDPSSLGSMSARRQDQKEDGTADSTARKTDKEELESGRDQDTPAGGADNRSKDQEDREIESADEDAPDEDTPGKSSDDDAKKEGHHPQVSFINLGDIFGAMGGSGRAQQKVKKKDRSGPKPVFTAQDIPAPHLLKAELDKYVIGQEHAKKVISVAAYNHYKRVRTGTMDEIEIEKSNILLLGPTGSGKTYLVRTLASLLDVPLAVTDATSLTEAGYIGDDVESCISKLLACADNDVEKAEHGIVFIDEIDKLAKKKNFNSRDVSGEAVQQGLLKLLEGAEVEVPVGASSKHAMVPMETIDTTNILFICGGAFPGLENLIKERLTRRSSMGFTGTLKDTFENDRNILDKVTAEDLRGFGMIPEFLGRLPVVCSLQDLGEDMLVRILKEPKNAILKQYQKLLLLDDVKLEFEDEALEAIAHKAREKDTGARALRQVIEDFMLDIMYEVPKDKNIGTVVITRDYVEGKGGPRISIRSDYGLPGPSENTGGDT